MRPASETLHNRRRAPWSSRRPEQRDRFNGTWRVRLQCAISVRTADDVGWAGMRRYFEKEARQREELDSGIIEPVHTTAQPPPPSTSRDRPVIRSCTPFANAISIVPPVPTRAGHDGCSGATETAANCTSSACRNVGAGPKAPVRACRRQTVSRLGCTSCRRMPPRHLDDAGPGRQALSHHPTLLGRRPPQPSLRTR